MPTACTATPPKPKIPAIIATIKNINTHANMISDYLKQYPSKNFNLRYVGKNLSDFILSKDPAFAAYADLAKLEWLLCAFDIDSKKKSFKTWFTVQAVWQAFQQGQLIALQLLPEKMIVHNEAHQFFPEADMHPIPLF